MSLISADLWQALWLTFKLAGLTALILLVLGVPLAYWLSRARSLGASLVETLISLPIVLPPTVIGFYLLVAFAPDSGFGRAWQALTGTGLAFTFEGLVIGSLIYSLPFAVQPFVQGFRSVRAELVESSMALGANAWQRFWSIHLPEMRAALLVGTTLSFAHTVGEFGVVLMLGGNIPGETRVASIALYDQTQNLDYATAHAFAALLLAISFNLLLLITWLQRRYSKGEFYIL